MRGSCGFLCVQKKRVSGAQTCGAFRGKKHSVALYGYDQALARDIQIADILSVPGAFIQQDEFAENDRLAVGMRLRREDDQVSNVKMASQAITVLKLLASFVKNKRQFVRAEHRDIIREAYTAQVVYTNR